MSIDFWIAVVLIVIGLVIWWKSPPAALTDHTTTVQRLADRFSTMGYFVTQTAAPDGAQELQVSTRTRTVTVRRYPGGALHIHIPGGIVEVFSESMARAEVIRALRQP